MTVREKVIEQIKTDLQKVTTSNGFTHDINASMLHTDIQSIDDNLILPVISVAGGSDESELTETGLKTTLKVVIIIKFLCGDTNDAELWFRDLEMLFRRPTQPDINLNHISELWNIDEPNGGIEYYYISGKNPFADDIKDNKQTILAELTISIININI